MVRGILFAVLQMGKKPNKWGKKGVKEKFIFFKKLLFEIFQIKKLFQDGNDSVLPY